ncbi:FecR family protein [Sphingobacterium bambusae]|uniref:FecR family protein n=1 Tax=Sphingobacterium bambusae TaxID=662858 RepID=A0ABW6BIV8_9SPHI|nr:FecR domain-containing protein [Sphingobacterium bambusae]WPL50908.1 FecR domain-containing protein [Sphingobacterium bambusae]
MESEQRLHVLFCKFLDKNCSACELQELFCAFDSADESELRTLIAVELERVENECDHLSALQLTRLMQVNDTLHQQMKKTYSPKRLLAVAATVCLFAFLGLAVYRYTNDRPKELVSIPVSSPYGDDVMPPSNKAVLRTSEGKTIVLSAHENGIASGDEAIHYEDGEELLTLKDIQQLTLETAKAAHYQAQLPDGTRVWLNASSSISYPSKFEDNERLVTVQGELFLDVSKDPTKPFVVQVGRQRVEVLGTSFNVNSYADDGRYYITLNSGQINISPCPSCKQTKLSPGQQAIITADSHVMVKQVNSVEVSSWKSGVYFVDNQTLLEFGRQISRWYDVEVDMGAFKDVRLSAMVRRDAKLSSVLQAIEWKTGIKFKIEERRVSTID